MSIDSYSTNIMDLLKTNKVFDNLNEETINKILEFSLIIQKKKKEFIFMQGEQASNIYIIIEGSIAVFSETAYGQEVFINIAKSGDIIGETTLLNESTYNFNTQALDNITLLRIPVKELQKLLQNNAGLAFCFLNKILGSYRKLTTKMEQNATLMAPQKLGCFLLKLDQEKLADGKTKITLPYEKKTIASYLQMTPETFSRTISYIEKYGVKISDNSVIINDTESLKNFSCSHCTKISDYEKTDCSIY